jgi:CheY-like chemotaxis protein
MPGQDGYSMMRALRGLPDLDGARVRAIAVSAYARREDKQRALKAGFNDHVSKPVQIDELYDALERISLQGPPALVDDTGPDAKVH